MKQLQIDYDIDIKFWCRWCKHANRNSCYYLVCTLDNSYKRWTYAGCKTCEHLDGLNFNNQNLTNRQNF